MLCLPIASLTLETCRTTPSRPWAFRTRHLTSPRAKVLTTTTREDVRLVLSLPVTTRRVGFSSQCSERAKLTSRRAGNWTEDVDGIPKNRWYPSLETLEDGSVMIIGGEVRLLSLLGRPSLTLCSPCTQLWGGFVNSVNQNQSVASYEFWPTRGDPVASPFLEDTQPANLCPSSPSSSPYLLSRQPDTFVHPQTPSPGFSRTARSSCRLIGRLRSSTTPVERRRGCPTLPSRRRRTLPAVLPQCSLRPVRPSIARARGRRESDPTRSGRREDSTAEADLGPPLNAHSRQQLLDHPPLLRWNDARARRVRSSFPHVVDAAHLSLSSCACPSAGTTSSGPSPRPIRPPLASTSTPRTSRRLGRTTTICPRTE
jgi:hypothetical protein